MTLPMTVRTRTLPMTVRIRTLPMTVRTRTLPLAASFLAAVLVLAGCTGAPAASQGPPGPTDAPVRPSMSAPDRPTVPPSAAVTGEVPAAVIDAARALLAQEIGADATAAATVVLGQAVTWPDGSLGCPEPGMFYTQALVPGYQVILEAAGVRYDYRAGRGGNVRACTTGRPHSS